MRIAMVEDRAYFQWNWARSFPLLECQQGLYGTVTSLYQLLVVWVVIDTFSYRLFGNHAHSSRINYRIIRRIWDA